MAASVVIPRPQQSYDAARQVGAEGRTLPWQLPVLLAHQLGLPPLTSGRFLSQHPVVGALSVAEGEMSWALAFRVVSGAEIVAELSTGADARFSAQVHDGVTVLRGARGSLAVVDSTLLLGSSEATLIEYSPYLARTLMPEAQSTTSATGSDAVVKLTQLSGTLFDGLLEASSRTLAERLQAAFAAEVRSRGASPSLIDVQHLLPLGNDFLTMLRTGVQSVSGGELLLTLGAGKLQLDGTISAVVDAEPGSGGACPPWMSVPQDVLVGIVLPERSISEENLPRVWASLGGDPTAGPTSKERGDGAQSKIALQAFARSLESPLLLALTSFEGNSMGFASAQQREGDDVDPVAGPASLLRTKTLSHLLQGGTFAAPKAPFSAEGAITAKTAAPSAGEVASLELAWKRRGSVSTWGLGSGARGFLSTPLLDVGRLFPSWQNLCGRSPLFALGFAHRVGVTDAAVAATKDSVVVGVHVPLELLFSWVQTGEPPL